MNSCDTEDFGRLFFDKRDHELIKIVNDLYDNHKSLSYTKKLFYPFFHPFGIKELAESKGLRIAYSVVNLLNSLEREDVDYRLQALKGLRDEIIDTTTGSMQKNTARVLLQIMKELVRARGKYSLQLELAHDFRKTASGKPRVIRKQLEKYHLLEMPEEWNQSTFDDHVHDANTKGRKTPTHLIMDAWIKGIRRLRVVYYQYIAPRFVAELSEAAQIMNMDIRIGIEFTARYRDRFASIIWVSRGLSDAQSFLCFLAEPDVIDFMEKGKEVMRYQAKYVLKVLDAFNSKHRKKFIEDTGIEIPLLDAEKFINFVAPGQASILHLGEYIHYQAVSVVRNASPSYAAGASPLVSSLHKSSNTHSSKSDKKTACEDYLNSDEYKSYQEMVERANRLTTIDIVNNYLSPEYYTDLPDPWMPQDGPDVPERLNLSVAELLSQISQLHCSFKITLNLSNLKVEDVLEILYMGDGLISRLEIFNLKDYAAGVTDHIPAINELQQAINQGSLIKLKRVVRHVIHNMEKAGYADEADRRVKLVEILHDLASLKSMYNGIPLKSRIGSDSTGRSLLAYGMGLGIIETLSQGARREIRKKSSSRLIIPIRMQVYPSISSIPRNQGGVRSELFSILSAMPGLEYLGARKVKKWVVKEDTTTMEYSGNIVTLGGVKHNISSDLFLLSEEKEYPKRDHNLMRSWTNLNTGIKNALKVVIGFVPAFATFMLTKDWWFLAWFGAFIWFGITGLRNIVQAVLGGGGIMRSPLLRWNDYVSWERLTDSLLFTGFSVPLLDYLVKTLILDQSMGITISTNPSVLYTVMALANGIYLSSHNAFRGLPKAAIVGNFFRSVFSIPIAIIFSTIIGSILTGTGIGTLETAVILQKWAAVISKTASDLVAALIEGPADRFQNISLRIRDYKRKFTELFDSYSKLELIFPDAGELSLLENPEKLLNSTNAQVRDLMTVMIVNALDMLYFWMYQPRARITLKEMMLRFTPEERRIFILSQKLLEQEQHISRLFVDGILGRKFSKPLSFYLIRYEEYLKDLNNM
ncbi:MAG: hypothetical protein HQK73_05970 [Desulfamplus sp.]|nr:hypothetical protein [Desulfamplus sp.]